jgi:multiple sugar transport system substrate-binding protein
VAGRDVGVAALEQLRELVSLCAPECLVRNPIRTYEAMAAGDAIAYCPFAYGYSNYARPGYARKTLRFGGLVVSAGGIRLRSTLGGTGLAISQHCRHPEIAVAYAQYVASAPCQRGLYFTSGGQPGDRRAWLDPEVNAASNNFFQDTLETLDEAYLRPRYDGYLYFQEHAGVLVHEYLRSGGDAREVMEDMDRLYRESQNGKRT